MAGVVALTLAREKGRSREEIEALESAFSSVDLNADGKVDINEYISILEERGIFTDRKQVEEMFLLADKDGDMVLSKEEVTDEMRRLQGVDKAFKAMDLNKDNHIDSFEMGYTTKLNDKQAAAAVKVSDKDQDGVLNKAEFCSMINKNKIRNPTIQRGDRMFDELDSNKDGFLDSKELSKAIDPSKAYLITKSKRVDKNRDGKLDRKEFRDYMDGSKKKY